MVCVLLSCVATAQELTPEQAREQIKEERAKQIAEIEGKAATLRESYAECIAHLEAGERDAAIALLIAVKAMDCPHMPPVRYYDCKVDLLDSEIPDKSQLTHTNREIRSAYDDRTAGDYGKIAGLYIEAMKCRPFKHCSIGPYEKPPKRVTLRFLQEYYVIRIERAIRHFPPEGENQLEGFWVMDPDAGGARVDYGKKTALLLYYFRADGDLRVSEYPDNLGLEGNWNVKKGRRVHERDALRGTWAPIEGEPGKYLLTYSSTYKVTITVEGDKLSGTSIIYSGESGKAAEVHDNTFLGRRVTLRQGIELMMKYDRALAIKQAREGR